LFTTPVVYLYLDQLSHWLSHRRSAAGGDEERRATSVPALEGQHQT
jgi:hypothetical protein